MKFSLALAALAAAATPVLSTVYVTNPVSSTSVDGGHKIKIEWQDSGDSPSLSSWEGYNIWLAAGSESSQYKLDQIASNLSSSKTSHTYKVPKNIGPDGKYYFIRFESEKTASNGTASYMAFSARFTLDNMSGTFNSTVMAAAQGKEGSASSSTTSTAAKTSSASGLTTSTSATTPSSTGSSAAAKSSSTSGASSIKGAAGAVVAVGAVAMGAIVLL